MKQLQNNETKDNRIKFNKISIYIELLAKNGLTLNENYLKHIEKEICELRPLRDRILFANWSNNEFIVLSIFMKETRKTPKKEIEKAKKLLEDYRKRRNESE